MPASDVSALSITGALARIKLRRRRNGLRNVRVMLHDTEILFRHKGFLTRPPRRRLAAPRLSLGLLDFVAIATLHGLR